MKYSYDTFNDSNNKYLIIRFPSQFRNNVWAEEFGEIQLEISKLTDEISGIILDISNCVWIDPMPLLSLLLSISEKNTAKFDVKLILPQIGDNNGKSNKVLAFLHTEGFLEQFIRNNVSIYSSGFKLGFHDFKKYETLINSLSYSNSTIIKASVCDLEQVVRTKSIDEWINKTIEDRQYSLKNKVDSASVDEVITRLRLLLSETIGNVYEHAYDTNPIKNVAFYVRFRNGLGNNKIHISERKRLHFFFYEEHINSPKLERYFVDDIFSFIEVFVIDSGKGMSVNYIKDIQNEKYPFRKAWKRAFLEGQRDRKSVV